MAGSDAGASLLALEGIQRTGSRGVRAVEPVSGLRGLAFVSWESLSQSGQTRGVDQRVAGGHRKASRRSRPRARARVDATREQGVFAGRDGGARAGRKDAG